MNFLLASLGTIVILVAEAGSSESAGARPRSIVGRWRVEFTLSDSDARHLRFDAHRSGTGAFLPLDPRSSLVLPPQPTKATWKQSRSGQVSFSGEVEFPIGNVGRQAGKLTFNGAFDSQDAIFGEVAFVSEVTGQPKQTGKFTARRIQPRS